MLPNYLVIGVARGGTSWIAKNLEFHPEVFMPPQKELHFFDRNYEKGIVYYKKQFKNRKEKMIGEATPAYLYFEHIPKLIKKHLPDVRLIVTLRDPVDRAFSHYLNLKAKAIRSGNKNYESFEKKIKITPRIIDEGFYYNLLNRYYKFFTKEQILILLFDDLRNDPINLLRKIYSFLEVDVTFNSPVLDQKINASSSKHGKFKFLYFLYRFFMKLNLFNVAKLFDKINIKPIEKIDPDMRKWLTEYVYLEQIELLENLLNRDLSIWKQY